MSRLVNFWIKIRMPMIDNRIQLSKGTRRTVHGVGERNFRLIQVAGFRCHVSVTYGFSTPNVGTPQVLKPEH